MARSGRSQHRRGRRAAAVLCLSLAAGLLLAPPARPAPKDSFTVGTAIEAWYYSTPQAPAEAPSPVPVPVPVQPSPLDPFPEETLHVAITGGEEQARSFITIDTRSLPDLFEVENATLVIPISPDPPTFMPEQARAQICLASQPAKSQQGSLEEPPDTDCDEKAPAVFQAKPYPHLEADITRFGEDLAFSGLAILPSERAREKDDTWHLALFGKKNETKGARPIQARLVLAPPDEVFDGFDDGGLDLGDTSSDAGTAIGGFSSTDAPSFDTAQPEALDVPDAPQPAQPAPELDLASGELEPAYTIVWALPLVLLALAFYFGSALTRDVVLRDGR